MEMQEDHYRVIIANLSGWWHEVDGLHFWNRLSDFVKVLHNYKVETRHSF